MSNAVLSMGHPGLSIYATFVGVWANRPHGLSFQNDGDCNSYILWPQCRLSDTFLQLYMIISLKLSLSIQFQMHSN